MTGPRIGGEHYEYRPICMYSPTEADPLCGAAADRHVLVDSGGIAVLATCGDHAHIARGCGVWLLEHAYNGVCGLPGTLWDARRNACVIDDSGVELPPRRRTPWPDNRPYRTKGDA